MSAIFISLEICISKQGTCFHLEARHLLAFPSCSSLESLVDLSVPSTFHCLVGVVCQDSSLCPCSSGGLTYSLLVILQVPLAHSCWLASLLQQVPGSSFHHARPCFELLLPAPSSPSSFPYRPITSATCFIVVCCV